MVENYVHSFVTIAFDVAAELLNRHVELFDLAGEIGAGGSENAFEISASIVFQHCTNNSQYLLGMIVHR